MIRPIWQISVAIEAVALLAYQRRGGFAAFRLMLLFDVLGQTATMWATHYPELYRPVFRIVAVGCAVLTAYAMVEAAPEYPGSRRRSLTALGIAGMAHILLYEPVYWSPLVAMVWAFVALGHLLMATYLILSMAESGRWGAHAVLLTVYMLGVAFLFYLAPLFSMAAWVEWWNAAVWAGFIASVVLSTSTRRIVPE